MKIVRPYAKLLSDKVFDNPMGFIEWAGRISHRSEEAQTKDTWRRFIETVVLGHGDWSIVEHVTASVDMLVDRGITHELVRHRLFSYTQESTRFVNYEKKMAPSFIYPKVDVECVFCLAGESPSKIPLNNKLRTDSWVPTWCHPNHGEDLIDGFDVPCYPCTYGSTQNGWLDAIQQCESSYKALLSDGWRPQEARSVFPNALASRIIVTGNLRNFRHLFIMRTTQEAHPQMRQVMIPLLAEFKQTFPVLFDDLEPNTRQIENLRKPR